MTRAYIRIGDRTYCFRSMIRTCYALQLADPLDDQDPDKSIQQATDAVNRILEKISSDHDHRDRGLALLAVPDREGNVVLRIEYVWRDQEVTYYDGSS